MGAEIRNMAVSVRQRLLNKARESDRLFNEVLLLYAMERLLYRISKSEYADRFFLKGALMFSVWSGSQSRPTADIDLLGRIDNFPETVAKAIVESCRIQVTPDGMEYDPESVTANTIISGVEYRGVRCTLWSYLGNARIKLQIDVGFGDIIVPEPIGLVYPTILDFPPPELFGYSMESTIAEKLHAMHKLSVINSRMKDFYDIWFLSRSFDFQGIPLAAAINATFINRKTVLSIDISSFKSSFYKNEYTQIQWSAFRSKSHLDKAPSSFESVVTDIKAFLQPVLNAITNNEPFDYSWSATGLWN
jgi:predicted nucleotidyltransferase component of viral defense system